MAITERIDKFPSKPVNSFGHYRTISKTFQQTRTSVMQRAENFLNKIVNSFDHTSLPVY